MRKRYFPAIVPLLLSGCLTPITERLDRTNQQVEVTNQELTQVEQQIKETGRQLARLEQLLGESNESLAAVRAELKTIDGRMETVERVVKRFAGPRPE